MHGWNDPELRQALVSDFLGYECLWDYANHLTPGVKNRISDFTHETDLSTPIN